MNPIANLTVERVPVDTLINHPRNVRRGDLDVLTESLTVHGQFVPLVVQRSTRHVVFVDVDDDQAVRIALIDNRSSDLAGYDNEALDTLFAELGGNLAGTGYTPEEIAATRAALAAVTNPSDTQESSAAEDLPGWEERGVRTIQLSYSIAEHSKVTAGLDLLAARFDCDTYSAVVARLVSAPDATN